MIPATLNEWLAADPARRAQDGKTYLLLDDAEIAAREAEHATEAQAQARRAAEAQYEAARADTTVEWNGATFRWHRPRHWEDWHRLLTLGQGFAWLDEANAPHALSHAQALEISALIAAQHQHAFAEYQAAK